MTSRLAVERERAASEFRRSLQELEHAGGGACIACCLCAFVLCLTRRMLRTGTADHHEFWSELRTAITALLGSETWEQRSGGLLILKVGPPLCSAHVKSDRSLTNSI